MPPRAKRSLPDSNATKASPSKSAKKTQGETAGNANSSAREDPHSDHDQNEDAAKSSAGAAKDKAPNAEKDPYEFITICRPRDDLEMENRHKKEEDRLDDDELIKQNRCGGSPGCMCGKKPADHPEWTWVITERAWNKVIDNKIESNYRNPDYFRIESFNDHHGFGVAEMVENLLLEFSKAKTYKDQWVVVETLAHWMNTDDIVVFLGVEDGDRVSSTIDLVGTAFLTAFDNLDRNGLLKPDSEIKDLSLVMALCLGVADLFTDCLDCDSDKVDRNQNWPGYIVALAKEKDIKIGGSFNVHKRIARFDTDEELPEREGKGAQDRFRFKDLIKDFTKTYAVSTTRGSKPAIGGHYHDITKWTRKERAGASYDGKDPLPDDVVKALKRGEQLIIR